MVRAVAVLLLLVSSPFCLDAVLQGESDAAALNANPIRKVVTMLQNMVKKVEEEGEHEKELYDKFMCYCKTSGGDLSKSISDADTKMPQLAADIKEGQSKKVQLDEDLKQHQADRSAAKEAMAAATALREKESAAYAKEAAESTANMGAMSKGIKALEKGMAGSFLQSHSASALMKFVQARQSLDENDREQVTAFLSGAASDEYAPSSGEITGILKTMLDEMSKDFADNESAEKAAVAAYDSLMAAKAKEVNALSKAIEEKMTRVGELSVEIVQMQNDLTDTEEALVQDKAFLADMEKNCATKAAEWSEIQATRQEELVALAETIKVLNDDDALELFKKTLPGAAALVQVENSAVRAHALAVVQAARRTLKVNPSHLDFIALAIRGKKIGFDAVIKMIEQMAATLKTEQQDDDNKKEYCAKQFDVADDKKKALERSISDLETVIEETRDRISTVQEDIKALSAGIAALDKSVAEATSQRKDENEDFTSLMASDSAAKEILGFAKNRLNKFYNPKLYKAPPKRELSEEDRLVLANGGTLAPTAAPGGIAGTGVTVLADVAQHGVAKPPPPPEAPGAYKKKSGQSGGVIAMIDLLVKDLDKEMTVANTEEKDSQADYEKMMADSQQKRAGDAKSLANQQKSLADMQASLEASSEERSSQTKEFMAQMEYISSLHNECDWLLQYFDVRKEARTSEIDALGKAKAVLSGADFSLVQTSARKFLRRA